MLIRSKSDEAFLASGGTWDEAAGQKVIDFIERYLLLEDGRPLVLLPWMRDVIRSWYCWVDSKGRRTRIGLLTCARKNAKSILTFALSMYHLIADGVQSPALASCAVNREQAAQIFDWAKFSIENNAKLSKALHVIPSKKTILYPAKNGRYRSLASDSKGGNFGHGFTFLVHDEQAFWHKDDLYNILKNSTDARQGLQVITSTAGFSKNGIFYKLCQYGRKVLSGEIIDTTFSPWIFEVPEGEEDIESSWVKGNPSLGTCQSIEDFRHQWEREKRDATTKHAFAVLKFNQFKDADNVWIPVESWDQCKAALPPLEGRECVLGCDVGASRDLTAISAVFPLEDKKYAVKSWAWVPQGALATRDGTNATLYGAFQRDGSLTVTPGTATDEQTIIAALDDLRKRYKVKAVVFDKWQSLVLSNHCMRQGVQTFNFPQTHTYFHAPCQELEKLVNKKLLLHDGNPLLRWQVGHTFLDRDGKGYVKPCTSRPENKKDSLIALLMGLSQALQQTGEAKPSCYESRKLFAV